jgi:hypothetical protein
VTSPLGGGSVGDAYVDFHADTSDIPRELDDGLDKAGKKADPQARKTGESLGDTLSGGVADEVGKSGPKISRKLKDAIEDEDIDIVPNFRYDVRGKDGRFIARAAATIREEVEEAFSNAANGNGGFFTKLKQGVADAIGAGFNISGKSPLIGPLIPIIGAIVGLVGALLQIVNALAAVLTTIPALIGAIGLQVGVLFLAFKGVGDAVTGAFAATNADELKKALEGLTPSAQAFVKSLLPLKQLFKDLKYLAQENFFRGLGPGVSKLITFLGPFLKLSTVKIAYALGIAFQRIADAFGSKEMAHFLQRIIPATSKWIDSFGPAFATFLVGMVKLADATIPFLTKLGDLLNSGLTFLGEKLTELATGGEFNDWLNSMYETLVLLAPLLAAAFGFVVSFLNTLNAAGGKELIQTLTVILFKFKDLFDSETGFRALVAIVKLGIASMYVLAFVTIGIITLLATIEQFVEWLWTTAFPAIGGFFEWLGKFLWGVLKSIGNFFSNLYHDVIDWFQGLPGKIQQAIGDFTRLLYEQGKQIISGLIKGIVASIPGLEAILGWVGRVIQDKKGPESKDKKMLIPAGKQIMQGLGVGLAEGARDVMKQLDGFTAGMGGIGLNNSNQTISFGANAFQLNFQGALPTADEAMATGQAVGAGIDRVLAARNTRLAVRTL